MTRRRMLLLLIAALIGYSALFLLFPKVDHAARWRFALDRTAAINKAKETAHRFGLDTSGWRVLVTADYNHRVEYYLAKQLDSPGSQLLSAITTSVRLVDPHTGQNLRVTLNSRGELIRYRHSTPRLEKAANFKSDNGAAQQNDSTTAGTIQGSSKEPDQDNTRDRHLAENTVKQLLGIDLSKFSLSESGPNKEGGKFSWVHSDHYLKLTAQATIQDKTVKELSVDSSFTPQFQQEYDARRGLGIRILSSVDNIAMLPALILVLIFYFVGLARRQIKQRRTFILLPVAFLLLLSIYLLGNFSDDLRAHITFNTSPGSDMAEVVLTWLIFGFVTLLFAAGLYLSWAAGLALAYQVPNRRTIGLELLLDGKLLTKPVVSSIIAGLLLGGILAAIPYIVAASRLFHSIELDTGDFRDTLISRFPALVAFSSGNQYFLFIIFAFLLSLVHAYLKRPWPARVLIFTLAFIGSLALASVYISTSALILTSALIALLLTKVYYSFDLLAVMVSSMAAQTALSSFALLAQQSTTLQTSGWRTLIGLGVFIIISLVGLWKAREVKDEEVALPQGLRTTRAERERLKAEFDVARRAQQKLLPEAPPKIDGFEIAAICQPSREVGGDLYDFIPLPGGRLGIVVADVSGKGVPASLYMTLTKGLLDSVSERETDPGKILCEVNRHLYEVCRRKVFVTLFLGIIDPIKKTLDYARAGHNPTVFRSARDQRTVLLKSPGMGLGLNNGKIFDSSLQVATLQLEPGDLLFFYSDGITEAMNRNNEDYGEERLMILATSVDGLRAEEARDVVMADVKKFLGPVLPQDDQTLVVVRVL